MDTETTSNGFYGDQNHHYYHHHHHQQHQQQSLPSAKNTHGSQPRLTSPNSVPLDTTAACIAQSPTSSHGSSNSNISHALSTSNPHIWQANVGTNNSHENQQNTVSSSSRSDRTAAAASWP